MKILKRTIRLGLIAVAVGFCALMVEVVFHRYPTEDEMRTHFSNPPATKVVAIDVRQSDIGYFGLTIESASGTEVGFIETYPQWIWPGQGYDWSKAGY